MKGLEVNISTSKGFKARTRALHKAQREMKWNVVYLGAKTSEIYALCYPTRPLLWTFWRSFYQNDSSTHMNTLASGLHKDSLRNLPIWFPYNQNKRSILGWAVWPSGLNCSLQGQHPTWVFKSWLLYFWPIVLIMCWGKKMVEMFMMFSLISKTF